MTQRKRRLLRWFGIVAVVLVGAYLCASALIAPVIGRRLQEMVASHLNAELRIGGIRYHFPYSVTLRDSALVVKGARGETIELLKVQSVDLRLAELPSRARHRPLVIEKLILTEPSLRLIKDRTGAMEGRDLVKPENKKEGEPRPKVSEMFRLRRFAAEGARIVYEDRTGVNLEPVVWSGLHIDVNTAPQDGVIYDYHLLAEDAPLASIKAAGTFNVDELQLDVSELALQVEASPEDRESKVPGRLQELLRENGIRGELKVSGKGSVPLKTPAAARFDAEVELANAWARVPKWDVPLDHVAMKLRCSTESLGVDAATSRPATAPAVGESVAGAPPARLNVRIDMLDVGAGDTRLVINKGLGELDSAAGTWAAHDLLGTVTIGRDSEALPTQLRQLLERSHCVGKMQVTAAGEGPLRPPAGARAFDAIRYEVDAFPREFSIQPHRFPQAIEGITGTLHLRSGLVRAENLAGRYGGDRLFLASARMPLEDITREVRIEEFSGTVNFGGQDERYPPPLAKALDALHPSGLCTVSGKVVVRPKMASTAEYEVAISSDGGAGIAPSPRRIPLTNVRCDIRVTGGNAASSTDVTRFAADAFEGKVSGTGWVHGRPDEPGKRELTYEGTAHVSEVNVQKLAAALAASGEAPQKASGRGFADVKFMGTSPREGRTALDNLRAAGEFEVLDGDFWEVPVIKDVVTKARPAKGALTVGQAAGTFEIHNRIVELKNAAISAPVLGLQGSGEVSFDGDLNLRVVVAPLADWKDKLKSTGIPIVSDALGALAGGIQKIVNGATKTLLYEFRVRGRVGKPDVVVVPAPVLTKGAAHMFGKMISAGKDDRLLDQVKGK